MGARLRELKGSVRMDVLFGDVPERNAARFGPGRWAVSHGEQVLGWDALAARALRRAHALAALGVGQGDRVVLALPNDNQFHELTFAIWKLGATPTVVSPRLPSAELQAIVGLAEPRAVIAADPDLQAALGALPMAFGRDHAEDAPLASVEPPSWKAMTSGGSTGRPKLIIDRHPGRMPDGPPGLGMREGGTMLNPAPLYHNFPFAMTHVAPAARALGGGHAQVRCVGITRAGRAAPGRLGQSGADHDAADRPAARG